LTGVKKSLQILGSRLFADGLGRDSANNEQILVESSSNIIEEGVDHTIGGTVKQLESLSNSVNLEKVKYKNASVNTFTNLKKVGMQVIRRNEQGKFLYLEPSNYVIPNTFQERFQWLQVIEAIVYLFVSS
jgi:hypothetical protein